MQDFKKYLTEKNKLMKKYDKGEINILSYNVPDKKGKDYEYDNTNEILAALGFNTEPTVIINKFIKEVSKIPYARQPKDFKDINSQQLAKDILRLNDKWGMETFIKDTMDTFVGKWSMGTIAVKRINEKEEEITNFYNNKKNYDDTVKKLKALEKYGKYIKDSYKRQIQKAEAKLGIPWSEIKEGFKYIDYFRHGSGRKMPKTLYPFLHAVTIKANKVKPPKTVYRGYLIDGEKVDSKQDYTVGSKIKLNNKKATSWSTSIGMAIEFSTSQDNIKDKENGYQLVVKYDIQSEDDIIADFRGFKEMSFFNQQEILISSKVKYATIVYSKKGDDYETSIRKNEPTKKGDSAGSFKLSDYLERPEKIKDSNLSIDDKIKLKEIFNTTLDEVFKKYPMLASHYPKIGCLGKTNAYLGLNFKSYSDIITNCSYNGFDINKASVSVYADSNLLKDLESKGIKIKNKWIPEITINISVNYTIKPNGYNPKITAIVTYFNIVAEPGENFEHNTSIMDKVKKEIVSNTDTLKLYLPGSVTFKNLKVISKV